MCCPLHDTRKVIEHSEAIKVVFRMETGLARKLRPRDFVRRLVEISDRAEGRSDRFDILVAGQVL